VGAPPPSASNGSAGLLVDIGPLGVRLEAGPRLQAHLPRLFEGFRPGLGGGRFPVHVAASRGAPARRGLPELPTLEPVAPDVLVDCSEGWRLRVRDGREAVRATAQLRDYGDADARLLRQVEGLIRVVAATAAPRAEALLVHGCALEVPGAGGAWLFVGPSGAGKSTMARRLPGWRLLADDTVIVSRSADGFRVAGTPFAGKERLPRDGRSLPLRRLVTLTPRRPLNLTAIGAAEAFRELLSRTMWFAPRAEATRLLWELAAALAAEVPAARLESALGDDVGSLILRAAPPPPAGGLTAVA